MPGEPGGRPSGPVEPGIAALSDIGIVEDSALKALIRPIADSQPQVEECPHLPVFAAWPGVSKGQIEGFIRFVTAERGIPEERLDKTKGMLMKDQLQMDGKAFLQWDALLELPGLGSRSTVLLALGFRDTEKYWLVNLKKVRRPAEEPFFPAHNG